LALNGALHDAAIWAWGNKDVYDSSRPITLIRYMAGRGQSSDPAAASYHPDGLPLVPDLIEVITADTTRPGGRHEPLAGTRARSPFTPGEAAPLIRLPRPAGSAGSAAWSGFRTCRRTS